MTERCHQRELMNAIAVMLAVGVIGATPGAANRAPQQEERFALLIGINRYKYLPDLAGAGNDVALMHDLLVSNFGFPSANIQVLRDAEAHREGILDAFDELLRRATPGAAIVIYFTGHGSRLTDDDPKEEPDGLDESIVTHDSGRGAHKNFDITDDTINEFLAALTSISTNVSVIFDSCNSGTMTRSAHVRLVSVDRRPPPRHPKRRWMARDPVKRMGAGHSRSGISASTKEPPLRRLSDGEGWRPKAAPYVAVFASRSQERAIEQNFEGKPFGVLTWHLVRALKEAAISNRRPTYRDVFDVVRARVEADTRGQHPQIAGRNLDAVVFGTEIRPSTPYAVANPSKNGASGRINIAVGTIHGATVGAVFEVYPPGTKIFTPGTGAIATLSAVGTTKSSAQLEGGQRITAGSRAVERSRRTSTEPLRVRLLTPKHSTWRARLERRIKQAYTPSLERDWPTLPMRLVGGDDYDLVLRESSQSMWLERWPTAERRRLDRASLPVSLRTPDALETIVAYLEHWAKWYAVLRLRNRNLETRESDLQFTFQVSAPPGRPLVDGENFSISIVNRSKRRNIYPHLLYLSSDGSIDVVMPRSGPAEFVSPGRSFDATVTAVLPANKDEVVDVLKLIATTLPGDFRVLTQGSVFSLVPGVRRRGGHRSANDVWRTATSVISIKR